MTAAVTYEIVNEAVAMCIMTVAVTYEIVDEAVTESELLSQNLSSADLILCQTEDKQKMNSQMKK